MVSGAADNTLRLWDVSSGKCLYTWEFPTAVKRVAFKADDSQVVCITEQRMGHQCAIRVFNINREGDGTKRACFSISHSLFLLRSCCAESKEPLHMFNPIGSKATVCAFTLTPNIIITGHESGKVALFNVKTGDEVDSNERAHGDVVTDMQMSKDGTYCITASKDKSARVRFIDSVFLGMFVTITLYDRYTTQKVSWSSKLSRLRLH
jgi:translation initiation factor 3 subunit I